MSYLVASLIIGAVFFMGCFCGYLYSDKQWRLAIELVGDEVELMNKLKEKHDEITRT